MRLLSQHSDSKVMKPEPQIPGECGLHFALFDLAFIRKEK